MSKMIRFTDAPTVSELAAVLANFREDAAIDMTPVFDEDEFEKDLAAALVTVSEDVVVLFHSVDNFVPLAAVGHEK